VTPRCARSLSPRLHLVRTTVELTVADTGCGISSAIRKALPPIVFTKQRGTGLGLAIVPHLLAEHNAHIRVEDNRPVGARFIIEFPAIAATESVAHGVEVSD